MVFFSGFREKLHGGNMYTPGCQGKVEALHDCNGSLNTFPALLWSEPGKGYPSVGFPGQGLPCSLRGCQTGFKKPLGLDPGLFLISALE